MLKITTVSGQGIPVKGNDIDTDQIIPARYLKVVTFAGIGKFAFKDVRFDDNGSELDHPFNDKRFAAAQILVVNDNFGCGSSREHAPQALKDHGITAIIGESFAEIFAGNCTSIGIPTATLPPDIIESIQQRIEENPDAELRLDLEQSSFSVDQDVFECSFKPPFRAALISGMWDTTAALLSNNTLIQQTMDNLPYIAFSKKE